MSRTKTRRCVGSQRFGIEPHEAATDDFPKQPSQPDGLGRMCREHWKVYTSGLRKDALGRKAASDGPPTETAPTETEATEREDTKPATRTTKPRRRTRARSPEAVEDEHAEALITEVDALPADQHVERVGDADIQAALEVSAATRMLAD